jgi:hypothetical protein
MSRLSSALFIGLVSLTGLRAQTSDIVVFSEAGEKFTLVVDGEERNSAPASRVVATGIKNPTPQVLVRFADASVPPLKQNAWMEPGQEYTVRITTNKKGERVFRMQGTAPLGTAGTTTPDNKLKPAQFVDNGAAVPQDDTHEDVAMPTEGTTTTTTVITTESSGAPDDNVVINMQVPGMGVNMTVNEGMGSSTQTTTTHTTTTTHASSFSSSAPPVREPAHEEEVYRMPGYSGPVGCAKAPVSEGEFTGMKENIAAKNFEDTKVSTAKMIAGGRCLTAAQVRSIMQLFNFEDNKLDFAKFAYDRTYDIGNYFKVNDVFNFDSSVEELNTYIQSR